MKKLFTFLSFLIPVAYGVAQITDSEKNIATQLLKSNSSALIQKDVDLDNSSITNAYIIPGSDIRMVYLQQTYQNIPVYNQVHVVAFKTGQLASVAGSRLNSVGQMIKNASPAASVSSAQAVKTALSVFNLQAEPVAIQKAPGGLIKDGFGKLGVSLENITAELLWLPVDDGKEVKLVWQVFIAPRNDDEYWLIRIDAKNNSFINRQSLTITCNWDEKDHSAGEHHAKNHQQVNSIDEPVPGELNPSSASSPLVVNTASYRVVKQPAESPSHPGGTPVLVTDPWTMSPGNATSLGWHNDGATSYSNTRGNNVYAYEDRNADNAVGISETSTTAQPNLTFNFIPDFTLAPTVRTPAPNQQFNTTNLFYWNNLMHDLSYQYGFTEAARNFQNNNQGRGGAGADYVLAESQDGSGTNNANFSTPADGGRGRMQMYLWTAPTPDRDGDVDNGIIAHEYTHGISNRLTGNGSTCLTNAEQAGEGWSDYYGLMITQNWSTTLPGDGFSKPRGIGTYALNQPTTGLGIRQYRYTTDMASNPLTYGNLASVVAPHGVGTIWCTALWEMTWEIIQIAGINPNIFNVAGGGGNVIALKLVTEGMRLQPCSPGFIDARNAILKADTLFYGAQYSCAILKAFAKRGMGIGAAQGSSNSRSDQTLSYIDCSSATCNAPTGLNTTAITSTGATLNWSAAPGAINYTVEYKVSSTIPWSVAAASTTATSVNLTGLSQSTTYDWRVKTNCSGGSSGYAQSQFSTTSSTACNAPTGLSTSAITSTGAIANWAAVSGALSYKVEYKLSSAGTWSTVAAATTATSQSITGLTAGTSYDWRVTSNCSAGTSAAAQTTFTTTSTGCASIYDNTSNGTASGAPLIPFNTNITGLINPSGDNDYFKVVISTRGTATITLSTLPGDYDLRLYGSNGTSQLAISQNGGTTSETISGTFSVGTYYVRVYGYAGANNATLCYTLRFATGTASFGADQITDVITRAGVYPNPANSSVTISLDQLKGSADLLLYDVYGKLLIKQRTSQLNTRMNIEALPAGTYIIKIRNDEKESNIKLVKQ